MPLLPRVILDRGGGSVLMRKPKAVIVFPSALIRMNDSKIECLSVGENLVTIW